MHDRRRSVNAANGWLPARRSETLLAERLFVVLGCIFDGLAGGLGVFADTFDRVAGGGRGGKQEGKGGKCDFHVDLHVPLMELINRDAQRGFWSDVP